MRIGTWNLAGRWDERHLALMERAACDVWLLTEVSDRLALPGYYEVRTDATMPTGRAWAGVFTREELRALPDPHPATAAAVTGDLSVWSSILPWRGCGASPTWVGDRHADKTRAACETLLSEQPAGALVWGGDWNHALSGQEHAGSIGGRGAVLAAVATAGLRVPTAELAHRIPGLLSIDHIAIPTSWDVDHAARTSRGRWRSPVRPRPVHRGGHRPGGAVTVSAASKGHSTLTMSRSLPAEIDVP